MVEAITRSYFNCRNNLNPILPFPKSGLPPLAPSGLGEAPIGSSPGGNRKKIRSSNDSNDEYKEKLLKLPLSNDAVNEFSENPRILSCAFPWLFPLGVTEEELGGPGTVSEGVVRRLSCS